MEFAQVTPDSAWLEGRRAFVRLMAEAAAKLGGRLELETVYGHVGRYTSPDGSVRPIFGNALGLNAEAAAMLAADKDYTARCLAAEGIAVPDGLLLFSEAYRARMALKNRAVAEQLPKPDAAADFTARVGYPVFLKPNSGSEGRGVSRVSHPAELRADLASLLASDDRVRVEACVPGQDVRLTVLDGAVHLAYRRLPPVVTCDGRRSLSALIAEELARLAQAHRGSKLSPDEARVLRVLADQGWDPGRIPPQGTEVRLLDSANLSSGGRLEDLTGQLPEALEALAIRAADAIGLRLAGVDLLVPDPLSDPNGATVIEVNAAPGLDYYASNGAAQWDRARDLVMAALRG